MARIQQAGGIVFKLESGEPRILLVRARKTPSAWVFPKGHIERGETAAQASLREVREEAGVEGVVVARLQPALEFQSGAEAVHVEYFLIVATHQAISDERREPRWVPPAEALSDLTHDEARGLLCAALPVIHQLGKGRAPEPADDSAFRELLIAEYNHLADSLLRNEADGEKRVTFFIALAGGVSTALGLVVGKEVALSATERHPLVLLALGILFAIGYLTLARIVTRNVASDRYKHALNRIRRSFLESPADPRRRVLAFDPYKDSVREPASWRFVGNGGWLPTVVLVNSILLGAAAAIIAATGNWWANGGIGVAAAFAAWYGLIQGANRRYAKAMRKEEATETPE